MCREKIIPPSLILVNIKFSFIIDILVDFLKIPMQGKWFSLLRKNDLNLDADHTV